jgi:hypothetical protein
MYSVEQNDVFYSISHPDLLFSLALQPSARYVLVLRGFLITHDTQRSVGLLWTSDQLVAETST